MMRDAKLEQDQVEAEATAVWSRYFARPSESYGTGLTFPRSMILGDLVRRGLVNDVFVHAALANRVKTEGEGYNL